MAVVALAQSVPDSMDARVLMAVWTPLLNGDTGAPIEAAQFADRSVQLLGTLGVGGNMILEGSNVAVPGASDWATLNDPQGNPISLNALKIEAVSEVTRWVRPRISAGDGTTSLSVYLLLKGED
jgi:hypothetical protein